MPPLVDPACQCRSRGIGRPAAPEITPLKRYPLNVNDLVASKRIGCGLAGTFHRSGLGRPGGSAERGFWLARYRMNAPLRPEQMLTRRESDRITDLSVIAHSLHR